MEIDEVEVERMQEIWLGDVTLYCLYRNYC